jgi:hypothetical protein
MVERVGVTTVVFIAAAIIVLYSFWGAHVLATADNSGPGSNVSANF